MIVLFLAGLGATVTLRSCADWIGAAGRPELFYRRCSGAAGSIAFLHNCDFPRGGESSAGRPGCVRNFCGSRLFSVRRKFFELRIGLRSSETHRRAGRKRSRGQRKLWRALVPSFLAFQARSWWPLNRRRFRASAASVGFSSSFRTWAATRCRISTTWRTKSCANSRQRKDLTGLFTQLHRQRSAAACADRSREGESHRSSDQSGDVRRSAFIWARNT